MGLTKICIIYIKVNFKKLFYWGNKLWFTSLNTFIKTQYCRSMNSYKINL